MKIGLLIFILTIVVFYVLTNWGAIMHPEQLYPSEKLFYQKWFDL